MRIILVIAISIISFAVKAQIPDRSKVNCSELLPLNAPGQMTMGPFYYLVNNTTFDQNRPGELVFSHPSGVELSIAFYNLAGEDVTLHYAKKGQGKANESTLKKGKMLIFTESNITSLGFSSKGISAVCFQLVKEKGKG